MLSDFIEFSVPKHLYTVLSAPANLLKSLAKNLAKAPGGGTLFSQDVKVSCFLGAPWFFKVFSILLISLRFLAQKDAQGAAPLCCPEYVFYVFEVK